MVVVPAGRDEQGAWIEAGHHVEPERADPEGRRGVEVGDLEMDVPEHGPLGHRGRVRVAPRLGEDALEVERQRRHRDLVSLARPLLARAVPVELDPVALRVGEVEGLADEVVRGAAQVPARLEHAPERAREVGPGRDEQREMEQARRRRGPRGRVGRGHELDERYVARTECRDAVARERGRGARSRARRSRSAAQRRRRAAGSLRAACRREGHPPAADSSSSAHELMQ